MMMDEFFFGPFFESEIGIFHLYFFFPSMVSQSLLLQTRDAFAAQFGTNPQHLAFAPGRTNIIGEVLFLPQRNFSRYEYPLFVFSFP